MAKDIQSIQRAAYAVIAFILIFGLGGFGYYTWTGTVVHPGPNDYPSNVSENDFVAKYPAAAALTVDEVSKGIVLATFRLTNSSQVKLLLPDTAAMEPLYAVSLRYSSSKEAPLAVVPRRGQPAGNGIVVQPDPRIQFDHIRDGIVELIPGSSLVKSIGLAQYYDLQKPGRYELTVKYQPINVSGTGPDCPQFNVSGNSATVVFELPLNPALEKTPNQKSPLPLVRAPGPAPAPAPVTPENPNAVPPK